MTDLTQQPRFDFAELDPNLILDAIESLGLRVESGLLALNSYENRVYQFIADGTRFVVKFYRPDRWTQAQLQEEHDFALELAEHEIPIVAPSVIEGDSLHRYQGYYFVLYPSVGGRQFEVDNLEQLEWVGRFLGRIHMVAKRQAFQHRPSFTIASHLTEPLQLLQDSQLVSGYMETSFFTVLEQVANSASQLYQTSDNMRLHGDCHPSNIMWRDGPSFVDLDDCRLGPAIQDIWMMLSGDKQQQLLQLDTIACAYEEFSEFPNHQCKLIEPLRAMRIVHYMAWLAKRWNDPAFKVAFPWFATDKYWEQQVLALKEQLSALHEEPLSLGL